MPGPFDLQSMMAAIGGSGPQMGGPPPMDPQAGGPPMPGAPPPGGAPQGQPGPHQGGPPDLSFIIGMLAGAGIPVLSRAFRPGRTGAEQQQMMGPLGPAGLLEQLGPFTSAQGPGSPSLLDILPALAAKMGPGISGIQAAPGGMPPGMPPPGGMPPQIPMM